MQLIHKGRGEGKTTTLVRASVEFGHNLVCRDYERAKHAEQIGFDVSRYFGKRIPYIYQQHDLWRRRMIGQRLNLLIDDADDMLRMMARGIKINAIAVGELCHESLRDFKDCASLTHSYIVTNEKTAREALTIGYHKILSFDEFLSGEFYAPGIQGFCINRADELIKHVASMSGHMTTAMSMTQCDYIGKMK